MAREPKTLAERRAMLRQMEEKWLQGRGVDLGIFIADQVAGSCGLYRHRGGSALEVGYWVHQSYVGKGLGTAVVRLLTDAAFSVVEITHVEIHADKANSAALAIPRRLGFQFVGETREEPTAPAEVGIECGWRMDRIEWQHRAKG